MIIAPQTHLSGCRVVLKFTMGEDYELLKLAEAELRPTLSMSEISPLGRPLMRQLPMSTSSRYTPAVRMINKYKAADRLLLCFVVKLSLKAQMVTFKCVWAMEVVHYWLLNTIYISDKEPTMINKDSHSIMRYILRVQGFSLYKCGPISLSVLYSYYKKLKWKQVLKHSHPL